MLKPEDQHARAQRDHAGVCMKRALALRAQVDPMAFELHALRHHGLIRLQHEATALQRMRLRQRGKFTYISVFHAIVSPGDMLLPL